MAVAVLPLLAHIEKRDLAAVAEPSPQGRDIDEGRGFHLDTFQTVPRAHARWGKKRSGPSY